MKNISSSSPTVSATLTNPLTDWRVYAAAGVATLAAASAADASIIYSGLQNLQQTGSGQLNFSVGGQKATVDVFHDVNAVSGEANVNFDFATPPSGAYAKVFTNSLRRPIDFGPGSAIGGGQSTRSGTLRGQFETSLGSKVAFGNFKTGKSGYVGFQFPASVYGGGKGWIRVKVDADAQGFPDGVEVIDWAYNDAGGGISGGQGIGSPVPEPGTKALALLSLGSAGVLAWRKRKQEARCRMQHA